MFLQEEIQRLLDAHITRPSHSPWSAPCAVVRKMYGDKRLAVNDRRLSEVLVHKDAPVPRVRDH
jgi:hypothetical protein